jgi:hypothetical protein
MPKLSEDMGIAKATEEIAPFEAGLPAVMNRKAMKSIEDPRRIHACFSPPSVKGEKREQGAGKDTRPTGGFADFLSRSYRRRLQETRRCP